MAPTGQRVSLQQKHMTSSNYFTDHCTSAPASERATRVSACQSVSRDLASMTVAPPTALRGGSMQSLPRPTMYDSHRDKLTSLYLLIARVTEQSVHASRVAVICVLQSLATLERERCMFSTWRNMTSSTYF